MVYFLNKHVKPSYNIMNIAARRMSDIFADMLRFYYSDMYCEGELCMMLMRFFNKFKISIFKLKLKIIKKLFTICMLLYIIEASRGAGAQSVTVNRLIIPTRRDEIFT